LWIGASYERAAAVAGDPHRVKATARDLGASMARRLPAGLTVSATLVAAGIAGIQTFATGGIGGVHRDAAQSGDISSDLLQLTRSPVITVCSGAKSVLDLSRTLEYLETAGVPVFAYRSEEFPAFFLRTSGIPCAALDSPLQIAQVARLQWNLGSSSALVIGNPLPAEHAIDVEMWERWSATAHRDAQENNIRGKAVTPYLLDHVARASQGETVRANLVLLEANARLAAEIAIELLR
ncbi:MAG: pseudouridine-5'-phosphate glycosidase, partial [Chloroflexota bacterium]